MNTPFWAVPAYSTDSDRGLFRIDSTVPPGGPTLFQLPPDWASTSAVCTSSTAATATSDRIAWNRRINALP